MNENLSSQHEVDLKCKQLARKWHPDKYIKNLDLKLEAEKKFMEIQAACNLISENRVNKIKQNQKSSE